MEYKGYEVKEEAGGIAISEVRDFEPAHVFDCGQCFRWIKQPDGSYRGIVRDRAVQVSKKGNTLYIANTNQQDFMDIWYEYFDLGTDYSEVKKILEKDEILKEAVKTGGGIRLLRQDFWETLISFIISANNRIPRIMNIVDDLSALKGQCIDKDNGYYGFPGTAALAASSFEEIQACKAGYRCAYIHRTAQMMKDTGITREKLLALDTDQARKELMNLPGVGPKVADCILLFSGLKYDVFPTDVWVKRVMEELYFKREASLKEIQEFAKTRFGKLTGHAQQYLFYHARLNRIGMS